MKKNIRNVLMLLIPLVFFLVSCSGGYIESSKVSVRVSIKSDIYKDVNFRVYIENGMGQAVNGAVVLAKNRAGVVAFLEFDNSAQCYVGTMNGVDDDVYTLSVKSNAMENIYTMQVPHTRLFDKPKVKSFMDSDGNDVMKGCSLKKSNRIQIVWEPSGKDVSYQVIVKNATSTKWTASVNGCSVTVPANVLDGGTYYLCINAQKSYGDMYYQSEDFYSVSNISSSSVSFCVE